MWLGTGQGQGVSTEALGSQERRQFGYPAVSFRIDARETSSEAQSSIPHPDSSPLTTWVWEKGPPKALQGFEEKTQGRGNGEMHM